MRSFGMTSTGRRRRSSLVLGREARLQFELLAFYQQHDRSRATIAACAALLEDFELEELVPALQRKYGVVPQGAAWQAAGLMNAFAADDADDTTMSKV